MEQQQPTDTGFKKNPKQVEATDLQIDHPYTMLYGGSRCVSGDTILDGHTKTIRELAEIGKPVVVRTSHGTQLAEPPFAKGEDNLYRVDLECGKSIKVTSDHRFWSGSRWVKTYELSTSDSVAVYQSFASSHPQSNSEFDPLESRQDALNLKKRPEDCQDGCSSLHHLYDQQPHHEPEGDLTCRASQYDALEHSHCCDSLSAPESDSHIHYQHRHALVCNHSHQWLCRQSTMGVFPLSHQPSLSLSLAYERTSLLFQVLRKIHQQALVNSFRFLSNFLSVDSSNDQSAQSCIDVSSLPDTPCSDGYKLSKVLNITETAKEVYYTLHVPITEQYFANGILHHNSGKTFISVRNTLMRAFKAEGSRHLIARKTFSSIKRSIVNDTLVDVMALCFPDVTYNVNKTDWYMVLPNASEVWFSGLDDKERVDKILGTEYSTIMANEATEISWDTIETLMTRLAENKGLVNKLFCDCNPASKKHWTYTIPMLGQTEAGELIPNPEQWGALQMNPMDNVDNLPDTYLKMLEGMSKKKRMRFLDGVFSDDTEGALWDMKMIADAQTKEPDMPRYTVVAIDPAVTHTSTSDETGIVVCSKDYNGHGIVHEDATCKVSTQTWARKAVNLYHKYDANCIVAEKNNGGDLIRDVIKSVDKNITVKLVHASKGKFARAEPVAALYEQGKVAHDTKGDKMALVDLENEMTEYVPANSKKSPNRLDALVWGLTFLLVKEKKPHGIKSLFAPKLIRV